jgi:hypothetical protein
MGGRPGIPYNNNMRSNVVVSRLPELEKRVNELENIISRIKKGESANTYNCNRTNELLHNMNVKQRTIKAPVSVSGTGLHTGESVTMTFNPAPEKHGYKFRRVDLPGQPIIDADVDNVTDTSRVQPLPKTAPV